MPSDAPQRRVRITDVSPRDGLQNEPRRVPTADKLRLIERLSECGLDEIEVASFVSPEWVPQLGDADELLDRLGDFADGVRMVAGNSPRGLATGDRAPDLPAYSALVPNRKGYERALAVRERTGLPAKLAFFTAASETFSKKNTNASIAESLERFAAWGPEALAENIAVRAYVSCAVACPDEGPVAPAAVRSVVDQLLDLAGPHADRLEIDLADTIGVATPDDVAALLDAMDDALVPELTLHLHDTSGRAAACVTTALGLGVRSFDGSVAGLGGCPFATRTSGRPAPGNISTAALVRAVVDAGYPCSVDPDLLADAADLARRILDDADPIDPT